MALIEFQVSAPAFLAAQRNALRARQICAPGPTSVGNVDILIDKIEFGGNTIRHDVLTDFPIFFEDSRTSTTPGRDVEGFQTQIAQDVTVFLTTQNDILSRPNQPPAISVPLKGALVFNLDFYTDGDECYLGITFKRLEPGPLPFLPPTWKVNIGALVAAAETLLQPLLAQKAIPAGLSDLTAFWTKFVNAGVSVNPTLQRITFRAQIGPYHDVGLWPHFLKGTFPERVGSADWAFYIDSGLITEKIKAEVNRAFDEEVDIDHLQTFVGCHYSNAEGKAAFTLNVLGIYDLPDPLGTVSLDPKLRMELSVGEPKAYDFGNPMWPTLVRSWAIPGVRGALTWKGSLLFFGDDGFGWIDGQGRRTSSAAECSGNPILDATGAGQALYAVTAEGLEIYTASLCKAGVTACKSGRSLVRMGRRLVVGGRKGLSLYDTEDPFHPSHEASVGDLDVRAVMRPMGTDTDTILASLEDGSARLLRVTGDKIAETATYAKAPWFAGSIRMGELLVRIGSDGRSLDVSRFGQSEVI